MKRPTIQVFGRRDGQYLAWEHEDDGEGGPIGQEMGESTEALVAKRDKAKLDRDYETFEYLSVEVAARQWYEAQADKTDIEASKHNGYLLMRPKDVKALLGVTRATLKNARREYDSDTPWPEWAKLAQAAGWKPPKGWKP